MDRKTKWITVGCSAASLLGIVLIFSAIRLMASTPPVTQPDTTEEDSYVCRLSQKQQQESIAAFARMVPTFRDARCSNCHGGVNPFAANTIHIGGRIGSKFKQITEYDEVLNKNIPVVILDEETMFSRCQDCHSGLPGWRLPFAVVWFVNKDTPALCMQMKAQTGDADLFINHLDHEGNPSATQFIGEAFHGTRGLDANGIATYEQATGKNFGPEPPPLSHDQFVQQGRDWITAMGGKMVDGVSCGCKPHQYALDLDIEEGLTRAGVEGAVKGQAQVRVPIEFTDKGDFVGTGQLDLSLTGTWPISDGTCTLHLLTEGERVEVSGKRGATLEVHLQIQKPATTGPGSCQHPTHTTASTTTILPDERSIEVELPAYVGEKSSGKSVDEFGNYSKVDITVAEIVTK